MPDFGEHGLGDRELPGLRRGAADQAEQHDGARVAAPVHEMAEARYLLTAPQLAAGDCLWGFNSVLMGVQLGGKVIWAGSLGCGCGCGAGTGEQQREAVTVLP